MLSAFTDLYIEFGHWALGIGHWALGISYSPSSPSSPSSPLPTVYTQVLKSLSGKIQALVSKVLS
ncbi:hypothetical protein [Nostoc sp.]